MDSVAFIVNGTCYKALIAEPRDISIPVRFSGERMSAFGVTGARKEVYKAGDFTGDVALGGSCNCETYIITPHCNGTHTECIGHIARNEVFLCDVLEDSLVPAMLVSVAPEGDVITRAVLEKALQGADKGFLDGLVVRTLPNDDTKMTRHYDDVMPPYFAAEAMAYVAGLGVKHLLCDLPSVDRMDDTALPAHRVFWGVMPGATEVKFSPKTITELIYVPDEVADGRYLLNLQTASFEADAAPSRPVLYGVKKV